MLREDGQRATVSAIAGMTGLSRKEVTRLQSLPPEAAAESSQRRHRAVQVLGGWIHDEEFSDDGVARPLPLQGEQGSFAALVKRYSGDVPSVAMLGLLRSSGNVTEADGVVTQISPVYLPMTTPLDKLEIFGTDGAELLRTIEHNIRADTDTPRFQRKVSTTELRVDALAAFRELNEREAMVLLEKLNTWLSENEVDEPDSQDVAYVSVGIYFYEEKGRAK